MSCNPKIRVIARKTVFCQRHPKVAVGVDHRLIKRHQKKASEKTGNFLAGDRLVQSAACELGLNNPRNDQGILACFFDQILNALALVSETPHIDQNGGISDQVHAVGSLARVAFKDFSRASNPLSLRLGIDSAAASAEAMVPLAGTMRSTTSEKVQPSFQLLSLW